MPKPITPGYGAQKRKEPSTWDSFAKKCRNFISSGNDGLDKVSENLDRAQRSAGDEAAKLRDAAAKEVNAMAKDVRQLGRGVGEILGDFRVEAREGLRDLGILEQPSEAQKFKESLSELGRDFKKFLRRVEDTFEKFSLPSKSEIKKGFEGFVKSIKELINEIGKAIDKLLKSDDAPKPPRHR